MANVMMAIITVELRDDSRRNRWCAECKQHKLHEWHDTSAKRALEGLFQSLKIHGYSDNPADYEIKFP